MRGGRRCFWSAMRFVEGPGLEMTARTSGFPRCESRVARDMSWAVVNSQLRREVGVQLIFRASGQVDQTLMPPPTLHKHRPTTPQTSSQRHRGLWRAAGTTWRTCPLSLCCISRPFGASGQRVGIPLVPLALCAIWENKKPARVLGARGCLLGQLGGVDPESGLGLGPSPSRMRQGRSRTPPAA